VKRNDLLDSYLCGSFGGVVVVVGGHVDVLMDAVQQPQEKLQGVVLEVTAELRPVFGHYVLERRETHTGRRCHGYTSTEKPSGVCGYI